MHRHEIKLHKDADDWDALLNRCQSNIKHDTGGDDSNDEQSHFCWNIFFIPIARVFRPSHGSIIKPIHQFNKEAFQINAQGRTPLHLCVFNPACPISVVKSLIGLNPHSVVLSDRYGCTPLHYASRFGRRRKIVNSGQLRSSMHYYSLLYSIDSIETHDFDTIKEEKERDQIIEMMCQTVIKVERQMILGQYFKFGSSRGLPCLFSCFNQTDKKQDGLQQTNAELPAAMIKYDRGSSDVSPLLLACERNAPLATICSLLRARCAERSTPITIPLLLGQLMKTPKYFPGSWIAPRIGAETWFSSCLCPPNAKCLSLDQYDSGILGNPFKVLLTLLKAERILADEFVRKKSTYSSVGKQRNGHSCIHDESSMEANLKIKDRKKPCSMRKLLVQNLIQYSFSNFDSDVYLKFASILSRIENEEHQLLHGAGWMPEKGDFVAIVSEILPAMEIAQKVGCMLQESARTPKCMCNLHHTPFLGNHHDHSMKGKMCHIATCDGENSTPMPHFYKHIYVEKQLAKLMHRCAPFDGFSPLHAAASLIHPDPFLVELLLGIFPSEALRKDEVGLTPIHHILLAYKMCSVFIAAKGIDQLTTERQAFKDVLGIVLFSVPDSANAKCDDGMTTTLLAIQCGLEWCDGLCDIVMNAGGVEALLVHDTKSNLRPFMLAASCNLTLDSIYELLRSCPVIDSIDDFN